jgi:dolichyl-phosphate beta-glucosyltransferase
MNISVVIPAYNEEKRLENSLKHIITYLKNNFNEYEIIVIDDCSADNTGKIASKYTNKNIKILRNETNRGKGYSVKRGILNAKYSQVLFSDSDLATPIETLEDFVGYMTDNDFDIVIASRNLKNSNIKNKQPLYRQIMGKIFPKIVSLILLKGFKDTQCGFKLFKTHIAKKIIQMQTIEGFSFDVEILFIANKIGCRIKEAPVVWIDKEGSTVRTFKDGFKMLIDLLKIRCNDILGKYSMDINGC